MGGISPIVNQKVTFMFGIKETKVIEQFYSQVAQDEVNDVVVFFGWRGSVRFSRKIISVTVDFILFGPHE